MTPRAKAHRASAQRRRAALLQAAAELSAEVGAGAVTHRAVAARAGVPLSTTSYFFSSIDELVTEALRTGVDDRSGDIRAFEHDVVVQVVEQVDEDEPIAAEVILEAVTDQAMSKSRTVEGGLIELYLAAGREPSLRPDATEAVTLVAERITRQLDAASAPQAEDAAWAFSELSDGAMLHRVAEIDVDHRHRLGRSLRLLTAAAMLTDDELDGLLERYAAALAPSTARPSRARATGGDGGTPSAESVAASA